MSFITTLGPETTAAEVLADSDLTGKRALITGGSGGLGAETARALAACGAHVMTITARATHQTRDVVAKRGSRPARSSAWRSSNSARWPASARSPRAGWIARVRSTS